MLQSPDSGLIARLRADAVPLRDSFAAAAADPRAFASDFYDALFELAPGIRALFPDDLQSQREKFAQTLATIVGFVDDPTPLVGSLRQLGIRHRGYGTQPQHYAPVGEALLRTLEARTPGGLPPEARQSWRRLYGWIVAEMLSGARLAP